MFMWYCRTHTHTHTHTHTQFFYHSLPADGHDFLKKNKYSFGYFVFNLLLYLLLLSGVIATAVIKDEKQEVHMTGVFSVLFAVLMFINLVAFLHLAIRLFFRVRLRVHSFTVHSCCSCW